MAFWAVKRSWGVRGDKAVYFTAICGVLGEFAVGVGLGCGFCWCRGVFVVMASGGLDWGGLDDGGGFSGHLKVGVNQ